MHKDAFLSVYPFKEIGVELVEGFSFYDGVLNDAPGNPHKGIDYILRKVKTFLSFDVFAMHEGFAYQGLSDSWGKFVYISVSSKKEDHSFATVYAHLENIPERIPFLQKEGEASVVSVSLGEKIGISSCTGDAKGIVQLHIELHERYVENGLLKMKKLDPYGINDRASTGKYPQPGKSLNGLGHFWLSDTPSFCG